MVQAASVKAKLKEIRKYKSSSSTNILNFYKHRQK
jgi:hypothetical protein